VREDRLGVIAALITERPLCASCITNKAGGASGELPSYLGQIGTVFTMRDSTDRCRACGALTTVFSVSPSRPED
jgi:hypothetical protein